MRAITAVNGKRASGLHGGALWRVPDNVREQVVQAKAALPENTETWRGSDWQHLREQVNNALTKGPRTLNKLGNSEGAAQVRQHWWDVLGIQQQGDKYVSPVVGNRPFQLGNLRDPVYLYLVDKVIQKVPMEQLDPDPNSGGLFGALGNADGWLSGLSFINNNPITSKALEIASYVPGLSVGAQAIQQAAEVGDAFHQMRQMDQEGQGLRGGDIRSAKAYVQKVRWA